MTDFIYPTYPLTAQHDGTRMGIRPTVMERFASNGTLRLRVLSARRKYDIEVLHGLMSGADRAALLDFYENTVERTYPFWFTAVEDGISRLVYFAAQPFAIEPIPGLVDAYQAHVYLREG